MVDKHEMKKYVRLSHAVSGAWWNEEIGKWKIKVTPNGDEDSAFFDEGDILINAMGILKYVCTVPERPQTPLIEISAAGSGLPCPVSKSSSEKCTARPGMTQST